MSKIKNLCLSLEKFTKVWYNNQCTTCLYFNKNTLAVINAPVQFLDGGKSPFQLEGMLEAIEKQEKRVASGDFTSSMLVLQDSMRIEYFERLLSLGSLI